LDLFCGAGGSAVGYSRAGFEVVGVDIAPQPHYPFEFHQADALAFLSSAYAIVGRELLQYVVLRDMHFDAIHASPPCQAYTVARRIHGVGDHPDLLAVTRDLLEATRLPWVIENVPGAPMRPDVICCGLAFGLGVKRHRLFESNRPMWGAPQCPHGHPGDWVTVFGHTVIGRSRRTHAETGRKQSYIHLSTDRGREAMGIDWMTRDELSQAIPPVYAEFIGRQLIDQLA
jgi:DNA (cytosine-5)-methyltransferase 1